MDGYQMFKNFRIAQYFYKNIEQFIVNFMDLIQNVIVAHLNYFHYNFKEINFEDCKFLLFLSSIEYLISIEG